MLATTVWILYNRVCGLVAERCICLMISLGSIITVKPQGEFDWQAILRALGMSHTGLYTMEVYGPLQRKMRIKPSCYCATSVSWRRHEAWQRLQAWQRWRRRRAPSCHLAPQAATCRGLFPAPLAMSLALGSSQTTRSGRGAIG